MFLFLDIDHTLLNTERFKRALAGCGRDLGVTPRIFWSAYRQSRTKGLFDVAAFLSCLPLSLPSRRLLEKRFNAVINDIDTYIYRDASYFLKWAKQQGHVIVLYTHGKKAFQKKKIDAIRRRHAIHAWVITADRTKRRDFTRITRGRTPWVWIDDFKGVPIQDNVFRGGTLLVLTRKRGNGSHGKPTVRSLYQAITFIQNISRA